MVCLFCVTENLYSPIASNCCDRKHSCTPPTTHVPHTTTHPDPHPSSYPTCHQSSTLLSISPPTHPPHQPRNCPLRHLASLPPTHSGPQAKLPRQPKHRGSGPGPWPGNISESICKENALAQTDFIRGIFDFVVMY